MWATAEQLHITAYAVLSGYHAPTGVAPSSFIRWNRLLKASSYLRARRILAALGFAVPEIPVPGSGQPKHILGRLQRVQELMKEEAGY